MMYGNPETTSGGQALKFFASQRIDVRKKEALTAGGETVGFHVRAKVVKNKAAPPHRCSPLRPAPPAPAHMVLLPAVSMLRRVATCQVHPGGKQQLVYPLADNLMMPLVSVEGAAGDTSVVPAPAVLPGTLPARCSCGCTCAGVCSANAKAEWPVRLPLVRIWPHCGPAVPVPATQQLGSP